MSLLKSIFSNMNKRTSSNIKIKNSSNNITKDTIGNKKTWVDAQYINDPKTKEKFLLTLEKNTTDPIDLHFTYNQLLDLYYKMRDKWDYAIDSCIDICLKDIDLYPEFSSKDIQDHDSTWKGRKDKIEYQPPKIPSFQRLAIIYDKQGKYDKAIEICEKAMGYNLHDGTKAGFEGRIERLKKK